MREVVVVKDFDPKGIYLDDNKKYEEPDREPRTSEPQKITGKVSTQIDQNKITKKKVDHRKSQKLPTTNNNNRPQTNPADLKEDSPRMGNLVIDELLSSIQTDLRYQREVIENLVITFGSLRTMVNTEAEMNQVISEKIHEELLHINFELKHDQTELKSIKGKYEKLQSKFTTTKKKRTKK